MGKRRNGLTWSFVWLLLLVSGCSSGTIPPDEPQASVTIDAADIGWMVSELSHELLQKGIDTVAIVDFTDSHGRVSDFERDLTEKVFLALSGFSGKLWVLSGDYLKKMHASQDSEKAVWHVMGVKAVVSGTVHSNAETVTFSLNAIDAETEAPLYTVSRECKIVPVSESELYIVETGERSRTVEAELGNEAIPTFPWPPPEASAAARIPTHCLISNPLFPTSLDVVSQNLETALDLTGYTERSYYAVPGGFALVTRLEQFNADGTSKQPPNRWSVKVMPPKIFSLSTYLKALFTAEEGHFRIIAFIVTSAPFRQNADTDIDRKEAMEWLSAGLRVLPYSIGRNPYTARHYCVALIYEFEQATRNHNADFKRLSTLPGVEHLKQAHIWDILEKE